MKKLLSVILALLLCFSCLAETAEEPVTPPDGMELARAALPLMEKLVSCSAFTSFEEEVPYEIHAFVRSALSPEEGEKTGEETAEETLPFTLPLAEKPEEAEEVRALDRTIEIEDAYGVGGGEVKVTLVVYLNGEFEMYCDIYLVYMQDSPFSSFISRVFIAE